MRTDPEAVVEGLYAAWAIQDVEGVLAYLHDSVRYDVFQPEGISGLGGEMVGKDAVRDYLVKCRAVWEFLVLEPGSMQVIGNQVREYMHFRIRHRATGEVIEGRKRHVWQVEQGRIASCVEYQDAFCLDAFLRMAKARQLLPDAYQMTTAGLLLCAIARQAADAASLAL